MKRRLLKKRAKGFLDGRYKLPVDKKRSFYGMPLYYCSSRKLKVKILREAFNRGWDGDNWNSPFVVRDSAWKPGR